MTKIQKLWTEKYRPSTIDDYVFQDAAQKTAFIQMILEGSIPHLLLSGVQGTGKTSIAKILFKEIGIPEEDILELNGSDENSVETVRTKIKDFINTFAEGDFKVVYIEEANYFTQQAQGALKVIMEESSDDVRFVIVTNEEHRILPPIRSRCQHFRFKNHKRKQVIAWLKKILDAEKIKYEDEQVADYVEAAYPDIRKAINLLQQNSKSGTLANLGSNGENADFALRMTEIIESGDWYAAIADIVPTVAYEEWEQLYKFIYENLHKTPVDDIKVYKQMIITVAEYLYRHSICADPAINAAAMFAQLSEL